MARRGHGRFTRPPAKTRLWIGAGVVEKTLVSGASQLLTTLNAAALLLLPFTILRTRLVISYLSDQITQSEFTQGAYGEIVVSESASTVGITAVPTPIEEPEADFYVFQGMMQSFLLSSAVGISEIGGAGSITVVDSKAMRKVGLDDDVVAVFSQRAAFGATIAIEGRQLLQLH